MEANYLTLDAYPGLFLIRKRDGRVMGQYACLADAAQALSWRGRREKARQRLEDARQRVEAAEAPFVLTAPDRRHRIGP